MTIYFGDGSTMAAAAGGNSTKLAEANGTLTSGNDGDTYEIVVTGLGGYHQINFSLFVPEWLEVKAIAGLPWLIKVRAVITPSVIYTKGNTSICCSFHGTLDLVLPS